MRLFVGDDWAEDHHDVELMDARGRVLARKRLPEGVAGMARLHELIGEHLGEDGDDAEVIIGTGCEHERGRQAKRLMESLLACGAVRGDGGGLILRSRLTRRRLQTTPRCVSQ